MPRKNKKGARGAQRKSHLVRELDKINAHKKNKKHSKGSSGQLPREQSAGGQSSSGNATSKHSSSHASGQHSKKPLPFKKGESHSHNEKRSQHSAPSHGSRHAPSSKHTGLVTGRLDIHPNGFAFVVPDNPEISHIYIPQSDFREYMHRDKVEARITRSFKDGKVSGVLVSVVKRQQEEFIGVIRIFAGGSWIIPYDSRDRHLTFEIASVAKNVELKNNHTVLCKVLDYPTKSRGKVEVIQSVDDVEKASNDTLRIVVQAAWPREFSEKAKSEAQDAAQNWEKRFGKELKDLTHIPFVTIDGSDARDFDDAVYATEANGNFELWVAIADVSRFVIQKTQLDEEAFARSTSVYFPDHVVPMLPEVLSNGICSLNPKEKRPALGCKIIVDQRGETLSYEFYEAIIFSHKRMTYEEMEDWLENKSRGDYEDKLNKSFTCLQKLTEKFLERRKRQGGLDLDIPEARVFMNKDGTVRDIQLRNRLHSHRLIEECMLAANRATASFLHKQGPALFRVHEKPNPKKVEDLYSFISLIGIPPPGNLETTNDFFDLIESIKKDTELEDSKKRALNSQVLRSLAQARYSKDPLGHFALNEKDYTHFTSPIRRYPDLVVHRLVRAHLEKKALPHEDDLEAVARHTSDCERQAVDMERKVIDIKKCRYVEKHLGEVFKCFVSGLSEKGLFCQIQDHFVDGLLDAEFLARRSFFFDGSLAYRGPQHAQLTFGSELILRLDKVDCIQGRINFGWPEEENSDKKNKKSVNLDV